MRVDREPPPRTSSRAEPHDGVGEGAPGPECFDDGVLVGAEGAAVLVDPVVEHVRARPVDQCLRHEVQYPDGAGVPADHRAGRVMQDDAISHSRDNRAVLFLAFAQRRFSPLPVDRHGNVAGDIVEDLLFLRVEAVGVRVALDHDDAEGRVAAEQRGAEPVDGGSSTEHHLPFVNKFLEDLRRGQERPGGAEDVFRQSAAEFLRRGRGVEFVDEVGKGQVFGRLVVQGDVEIPGVHQFAEDCVESLEERREVGDRGCLFRDPVEGELQRFGSLPVRDVEDSPDEGRATLDRRPRSGDFECDGRTVLPDNPEGVPEA